MSPEYPPPHSADQDGYDFTQHERLFSQINHERFLSILADPNTATLNISIDSNSFGEFLFVTTRRENGTRQSYITFYGLGFHEHRERWIKDEWRWYEGMASLHDEATPLATEEVLRQISTRSAEIASQVTQTTQSKRGMLYEMLADLTDEDGALSELEDLEDLFNNDEFPY